MPVAMAPAPSPALPPRPPAPSYADPSARTASSATPAGALQPAGFWIRVAAVLIDSAWMFALVFGVSFVLGMLLGRAGSLLGGLFGLAVYLAVPFVGWTRFAATPGKMALGLVVCDATSGTVGLDAKKAILRLVGYLACGLTFGIGYLLVAFSANRRGLHDLIAGTFVAHKVR